MQCNIYYPIDGLKTVVTVPVEPESYLRFQEIKSIKRISNFTKKSMDKILLKTFVLVTCIKMLLIPTYHSTDFEVHRNWLAITYNLPVDEWYVHVKSQWTLDYPPLFAWLEYFLSQIAVIFDPEMVKVENLNYDSPVTIYFQRATVMVTDIIFVYGVREISKVFCKSSDCYYIFVFLSLCNMGLLVIDHIHFQYNGFLLGILLLSIAKVSNPLEESSVLQGAVWFIILLNLKHIYSYVIPAYVVWLLRSYCMTDGLHFKRVLILAIIVLMVLVISFGPFIKQLPQVISRLFPFKRGLVHAYWAANGWALYVGVDKILSIIWNHLGWLKSSKSALMTGGLVQEEIFAVLPTPKPLITFILTFLLMFPVLYTFYYKNSPVIDPKYFIRTLILCGLTSFTFGWHVHEKAILTVIIPLCATAVTNKNDARIFAIISNAGYTALLPLLYPGDLVPLKLLLLLFSMLSSMLALTQRFKQPLLFPYERVYVGFLPLITLYESVLHKLLFHKQLPFLPLALTSIYCSLGITYSWILYYYSFLYDPVNIIEQEVSKEQHINVNMLKHRKQKLF